MSASLFTEAGSSKDPFHFIVGRRLASVATEPLVGYTRPEEVLLGLAERNGVRPALIIGIVVLNWIVLPVAHRTDPAGTGRFLIERPVPAAGARDLAHRTRIGLSNGPKLSHSRPTGTPADTTRTGTPAPLRNGEAGQLLAPARW